MTPPSLSSTTIGGGYPLSTLYPGRHDLLLGRGGETNNHSGNIKFRRLIEEYKSIYQSATKAQKPGVAALLVQHWRGLNPPGRFMAKSHDNDELWEDIGDLAARRRTSKSLGERSKRPSATIETIPDADQNFALPVDPASLKRKREDPASTMAAGRTPRQPDTSQQIVPVALPVIVPPQAQQMTLAHILAMTETPASAAVENTETKPAVSTSVSERLFGSMVRSRPNKKPSPVSRPGPSRSSPIIIPTTIGNASDPVDPMGNGPQLKLALPLPSDDATSVRNHQAIIDTLRSVQPQQPPSLNQKSPAVAAAAVHASNPKLDGDPRVFDEVLEDIPTAAQLTRSTFLSDDSSEGSSDG